MKIDLNYQLFSSPKFSNKKKFVFFSDLEMLISSGIDIITSFEIITDNYNKASDKELINKIKDQIIKGATISTAIRNSGIFSDYEHFSIKIGEETGMLNEVLKSLSDYYEKKIEQRRKIVSAFSYPIIVLITALLSVVFMVSFIVPMFADVYKRFGNKELPYLTKLLMRISHFFTSYSYLIIFVVISVVLLIRSFSRTELFKKYYSIFIIKTPLLGKIIYKIYLIRFCSSMELLTNSRTPLIKSVQLVREMMDFYPVSNALVTIEADLVKGISLHESLVKHKIFEKKMISLIKIGEEVNQLGGVFSKLRSLYSAEVEYKSDIIGDVVEPILIIFIGIIISVILIGMYLPIFQLSTNISY